jgi:hypothetical protein
MQTFFLSSAMKRRISTSFVASRMTTLPGERELGVQVYGQGVADMMPELGSESELEDEGEDDE